MKRRHKYDVTDSVEAQYADDEQEVLFNKTGITDLEELQIREEHALAAAYEMLLGAVRQRTPITVELIRHVHRLIFGELFEWAGRWRTVVISKPGAIWPPPQFLDAAMQSFEADVLQKYPASVLSNQDDFCQAAAEIQGEFLAIHPFREGNGRTIKVVTDLLATQTGRPLLAYDNSNEGADRYIEAAKMALAGKGYDALEEIIRRALETAESH